MFDILQEFLYNTISEFIVNEVVNLKLYLDNCCFNRPFDDQTQLKIHLESQAKLFIQQGLLSGTFQLVWSYILEFENEQNPYDLRKDTIRHWKASAEENINESEEILTFAEILVGKGIKAKDALHIACAVAAKCDYFLTTDKKLLKTPLQEIKVRNPIDFVREMEESV